VTSAADARAADGLADVEAARWLAPACLVGALCLSAALQISNGFLQATAIDLLTVALVCVLGAVVVPRSPAVARADVHIVRLIGLIGFAIQVYYLATAPPGVYAHANAADVLRFQWSLGVLALVGALAILSLTERWASLQVAGLVLAHAALGVWMIRHSPNPAIDVHVFQTQATEALRHGTNPYAITFPDIYGGGTFYGPGMSVNGRLQFGFPYFPLSLLAAMPGQLFGSDPRYAHLIAMDLAAILMARARPGGLGRIAATLYLTTPRGLFVLEQSWTEPFVVLGVVLVVFAACRHSRSLPWLFGALIALKQYMVFALPAAVLLVGRRFDTRALGRFLVTAAIVGAAITLPFVFWNPPAFIKSVVTLQFYQPFRWDALSYLAWWAARGHAPPSSVIPFAAATAASALALWRSPRTAAGFGATIALTFFAFFAFNKQAFCNYYFFVLGALFATVAAWHPPGATET
jgi:hypothetical protein